MAKRKSIKEKATTYATEQFDPLFNEIDQTETSGTQDYEKALAAAGNTYGTLQENLSGMVDPYTDAYNSLMSNAAGILGGLGTANTDAGANLLSAITGGQLGVIGTGGANLLQGLQANQTAAGLSQTEFENNLLTDYNDLLERLGEERISTAEEMQNAIDRIILDLRSQNIDRNMRRKEFKLAKQQLKGNQKALESLLGIVVKDKNKGNKNNKKKRSNTKKTKDEPKKKRKNTNSASVPGETPAA